MALNVDSMYEPYFHPPLTDTDYRTASRAVSRRTSRRGTPSPMASSTALPPGEDLGDPKEEISVLDPRRFTPTLHANLVSEILSLRRELENKNGLVLSLEEEVASVKDENTRLQDGIANHTKENRSMKRQMDALEGGTFSAIEELARERDKASESLAESKQRLEASQKKVRAQRADAERAQAIYERDRDGWDAERRILERRVHVVEGRLKTVLFEVESVQTHGHRRTAGHDAAAAAAAAAGRPCSSERPVSRASGARSVASRHRDSFANESVSGAHGSGPASKTLADELDFDDGSDRGSEGGYISAEALPEERPRPFSVQSHRQSTKARKLLGLAVDGEDEEEEEEDGKEIGKDVAQEFPAQAAERLDASGMPLPVYADSSTQYSSPSLSTEPDQQRLSTITEIENDHVLDAAAVSEQGDPASLFRQPTPVVMVSCACQTIEVPPSPPETPTKDRELERTAERTEMVAASTQTVQDDLYYQRSVTTRDAGSATTATIPTIAIHAVASESDRSSVVLPPHTSNASCQASIRAPAVSVSVQTEGIRIDERLEKLPAHLHPSVIQPFSPSPSPSPEPSKIGNSSSLAPRSSLQVRARSRPSSLRRSIIEDQVPGRNSVDDGRVWSEDEDGHVSDDSFLRRSPMKRTLGKVQDSWKLVSTDGEEGEAESEAEEETPKLPPLGFGRFGRSDRSARVPKSPQRKFEERSGKILEPIVTERPNDLKRTALISSGSAAHLQRGGSPGDPSKPLRPTAQDPPFPVPDRSSSRKLPWSPGEGSGSPTPRDSREKIHGQGRLPTKRPAMRKTRPEPGSSQRSGNRSRSRSPPPFESFADSLSSIPPPLPENGITSRYAPSFNPAKSAHEHHKSVTSAAETVSSDSTNVVDAIAQTMIGEWMWKYVRRRKSFGLPDTGKDEFDSAQGKDGMMTGGNRHQRWVWIAPYERAVMWSSKQPTSGSALMGKSGRKRMCRPVGETMHRLIFSPVTITSVLDVRDDTPMPKGAPASSFFGRSMLILTPQRALKFTAKSLERHHVWLSALSFLSHTAVEAKETRGVQSAMPVPPANEAAPPNIVGYRQVSHPTVPILRRHRIQDSIRVAKGKDRPGPAAKRAFANPSVTSVNEWQSRPSEELVAHGAEAPQVPRRTVGASKRWNTAPKSNPSKSLRSFSSSQKPSLYSIRSRRDSAGEVPPPPAAVQADAPLASSNGDHGSNNPNGREGGLDSSSRRGTNRNASVHPRSGESPNFFEAVGTVRMEAFVRDGAKATGSKAHGSHSLKDSVASGNTIVGSDDAKGARSVSGAPSASRPSAVRRHPTDGPPQPIVPARRPIRSNTFDAFTSPGSGGSGSLAPSHALGASSHAPPTAPAAGAVGSGANMANTSAKREGKPPGSRKRGGGTHGRFDHGNGSQASVETNDATSPVSTVASSVFGAGAAGAGGTGMGTGTGTGVAGDP
ncbi:MAG: hypothetical protein LQ340_004090, partial [Diploschistes diacapsis]